MDMMSWICFFLNTPHSCKCLRLCWAEWQKCYSSPRSQLHTVRFMWPSAFRQNPVEQKHLLTGATQGHVWRCHCIYSTAWTCLRCFRFFLLQQWAQHQLFVMTLITNKCLLSTATVCVSVCVCVCVFVVVRTTLKNSFFFVQILLLQI